MTSKVKVVDRSIGRIVSVPRADIMNISGFVRAFGFIAVLLVFVARLSVAENLRHYGLTSSAR